MEYKDTATVEQELGPAKEIRANIRDLLTNLEQDIRSDRVLDRERLSEAVENMTDSIIRNPDALFLQQPSRNPKAAGVRLANMVPPSS